LSVSIRHDWSAMAIGVPFRNESKGRVKTLNMLSNRMNEVESFDGATVYGQLGRSVTMSRAGDVVAVGASGYMNIYKKR
jgi:hypothetical protein